MERPPVPPSKPILTRGLIAWLAFTGLLMAIGTLGVISWAEQAHGLAVARTMGSSRCPIPVKETNYGRIRDEGPWSAPMGRAVLRSSGAFSFSGVVIEMKGGSRRHLASMARRLLTTPAARAGQATRWLRRSAPRAGPLAAAAVLAAGVLAAAGPLTAASAATVPPGLGGQNWTATPTNAKVVALTFDAGANADAVQPILATLGKYHVTATFMLTGNFVRDFPAQSKAIA